MKKRVLYLAAAGIALTGTCGQVWAEETEEQATILVAAAASLEYSMTDELIPLFQEQYQALMSTFEAAAGHVTGELRKVEVNLAQLPRTMDQSGAELKALSARLEEEIQKKKNQ